MILTFSQERKGVTATFREESSGRCDQMVVRPNAKAAKTLTPQCDLSPIWNLCVITHPGVTCNLRCSIATSDAPMHHLTLQTDRHDSAISRRISRFQARSPSSRPEKPVFMQSSAMRTQASVLDLQLQMDTLPRGPCHGFAIDALSRTLRPVSRHHVRSGT